MISIDIVNTTIENYSKICNEIAIIYKEWQQLKLQKLGYTWGFNTKEKTQFIMPIIDPIIFNKNLVEINKNRGCNFSFPISWISNKNWKNEAITGIQTERSIEILNKLN
jgi:hypothetical protein